MRSRGSGCFGVVVFVLRIPLESDVLLLSISLFCPIAMGAALGYSSRSDTIPADEQGSDEWGSTEHSLFTRVTAVALGQEGLQFGLKLCTKGSLGSSQVPAPTRNCFGRRTSTQVSGKFCTMSFRAITHAGYLSLAQVHGSATKTCGSGASIS